MATIEKSVTLYDIDVEIELNASEVAHEFRYELDDLLTAIYEEDEEAVIEWVEARPDKVIRSAELLAKKLTDHQKSHLSAAVLVLTALQSLTGKDYAETIRVLLHIETEMEPAQAD